MRQRSTRDKNEMTFIKEPNMVTYDNDHSQSEP